MLKRRDSLNRLRARIGGLAFFAREVALCERVADDFVGGFQEIQQRIARLSTQVEEAALKADADSQEGA